MTLLIIPISTADESAINQANADTIPITLYENAERSFTIDETRYTTSGTNALTALLVAAEQERYTYQISDEYYDDFSSFLIASLNGIENQGWDGWQFWVNYPDEDIPMVGANAYELEDGDTVYWFYGGYGFNPDTSDHVIAIEISIDTDEHKPSISIDKPVTGGIYRNNDLFVSLPFISSSILLGPITITAEATDEESGVDSVIFSIENEDTFTAYDEPYTWHFEPESGFQQITLTITVNDRSNHQVSINQKLIVLG